MKIVFLSTLFLAATITGLLLLFGIISPVLINQAYNETALSKYSHGQIESQVKNLRAYLNDQESLNQTFYTNRELLHLLDIKELVGLLKNLLAWMTVLLGLTVFHYYHTKNLQKMVKLIRFSAWGAALACIILTTLVILFFHSF